MEAAGGKRRLADLHDRGTIIRDCLSTILVDEKQISTIGPQCASDCVLHGEACLYVRNDLTLALRSICALLQDNYRRGLPTEGHFCVWKPSLICEG